MTALETSFFVTGGALHRDAASYVRRHADDELFQGLSTGQFCYVLTSRQMGKTSLMVRTAARLRAQSATVVVLDLTAIGQNLTAEQWYEGLLNLAGQHLHLEDLLEDFWLAHQRLGPLQRWMRAIREVVLRHCSGQVVIFVDEIDAVRSLPFPADEFFAGIREFYNARAEDAELHRLTFCLLGVATPSDLILDTRTTPFNIGRRIELHDFTEDEAAPLAEGFDTGGRLGKRLLRRVIHWTGGHPYLTQRLCQAIADDGRVRDADGVDRWCEELFFTSRARERDDNLHFVRARLLRSEADIASLLELYEKVYRRKPVRDDDTSALVGVLRLSGIVRTELGRLIVRNRIYGRVFDRAWVAANMPDAELQRQRKAYRRGKLRGVAYALAIIALLTPSWVMTWRASDNSRRLGYAAQMKDAHQAWEVGNVERVLELLNETEGQTELRSFEWNYLWRLCHSDLQRFQATDSVLTVAFSSDEQAFAAGSEDGALELRDAHRWQPLWKVKAHEGWVNTVSFSPDGKLLATGSDDRSVKLWETVSGKEVQTLTGFEESVHSVIFSARGNWLVAGSEDGAVKLWDLPARQWRAGFREEFGLIFSMALSSDDRTLALGSSLGSVGLWDITHQRKPAAVTVCEGLATVRALTFSPDGRVLATGCDDGTITVLSMAGKTRPVTFPTAGGGVLSLAFSPDGNLLAAGNRDRTATVWNLAEQRQTAMFKGHLRAVQAVAFSPRGEMLATGGKDASVKLWSLNRLPAHLTFAGQLGAFQALASPLRAMQLAAGGVDAVRIWDLTTKRESLRLRYAASISALASAPDGKTLAIAGDDESVKLWDAESGQEIRTFIRHGGEMRALAFSPDGKLLAAGGRNRSVWLWNVATGKEIAHFPGHTETIRALAFSPNGEILATTGGDGFLRLWDVPKSRQIGALKVSDRPQPLNAVAFSPDGQFLAAAGDDGLARLWDMSGSQLRQPPRLLFKGHDREIYSLAFTPDGKRLATASADGTVRLWDTAAGQEMITFKVQTGGARAVVFSADGKTLAIISRDDTIELWQNAFE